MSEVAEVGPARRNLLVLTSLLLVIELTGATIKSINAPAVTIDIQRPELIIWFLYLSLAYLMFRFWQIARATHIKHSRIANKFINQQLLILRIADGSLDKNDGEGYSVADNNPEIVRGLFKRELIISGYNKHGQAISKDPIKLPFAKMLIPELIADIRAIPTHKDFVEYTFPFLYANSVVTLKAFFILHTLIRW